MKPRTGKRKRILRIVLIIIGLLLLAAFPFFQPILFLPAAIGSHIPVTYEFPFPLKFKAPPPPEVPGQFSPEGIGMPDDHWGKRSVVYARTCDRSSEGIPQPAGAISPAARASAQQYFRFVYHGHKLTELACLRRGRPERTPLAPPVSHAAFIRLARQARSRARLGPDALRRLRVLVLAWRSLPSLILYTMAPWRAQPTDVRRYSYNAQGSFCAVWRWERLGDSKSPRLARWWPTPLLARHSATVHRYDEAGRITLDVTYAQEWLLDEIVVVTNRFTEDGTGTACVYDWNFGFVEALRVLDDTRGRRRGLVYYGPDGSLSRPDFCSSRYEIWKSHSNDPGPNVAALARFYDDENGLSDEVYFDAQGRVIYDTENDFAIRRQQQASDGRWQATVLYNSDGRLVPRPDAADILYVDAKNRLWAGCRFSHRRLLQRIHTLILIPSNRPDVGDAFRILWYR